MKKLVPTQEVKFLEGVPSEHILNRLTIMSGKDIARAKLLNNESAAALAVNSFGYFIPRPEIFPAFKGLEFTGKAKEIEIEFKPRLPWEGGKNPNLDAIIKTQNYFIGVESKRYEPYRDDKSIKISDNYYEPIWGNNMRGFECMRDDIRIARYEFQYLDAAQLVKQAFGLYTEAKYHKLKPVLVYLYAEPKTLKGIEIWPKSFTDHRDEIKAFADAVRGNDVIFHALSYREWIENFGDEAKEHGARIMETYAP